MFVSNNYVTNLTQNFTENLALGSDLGVPISSKDTEKTAVVSTTEPLKSWFSAVIYYRWQATPPLHPPLSSTINQHVCSELAASRLRSLTPPTHSTPRKSWGCKRDNKVLSCYSRSWAVNKEERDSDAERLRSSIVERLFARFGSKLCPNHGGRGKREVVWK